MEDEQALVGEREPRVAVQAVGAYVGGKEDEEEFTGGEFGADMGFQAFGYRFDQVQVGPIYCINSILC